MSDNPVGCYRGDFSTHFTLHFPEYWITASASRNHTPVIAGCIRGIKVQVLICHFTLFDILSNNNSASGINTEHLIDLFKRIAKISGLKHNLSWIVDDNCVFLKNKQTILVVRPGDWEKKMRGPWEKENIGKKSIWQGNRSLWRHILIQFLWGQKCFFRGDWNYSVLPQGDVTFAVSEIRTGWGRKLWGVHLGRGTECYSNVEVPGVLRHLAHLGGNMG